MTELISFRSTLLPRAATGRGPYIYDEAGRDYLDGSGGAMTVSLGHGVPEIIAAIEAQARKLCFSYRTQFTNAPAEELATALVERAPNGITHAFFVNSGSEAAELAIRSSIQYWKECGRPQKTLILGRDVSYHGMTMGALSLSGHAARRSDYANLLHPLAVGPSLSPFPDGPLATNTEVHREQWRNAIAEVGADKVAALIVEPVVGAAGGALIPPLGYMRMLREICDEHDILLIADEVITGLGRTGKWFACDHDDVTPDLITLAKGLTSGYTPMGAVLFQHRLVEATRSGSRTAPFGHTFSGNPLSAATSLAVLRYIQTHNVLENVAERADQLREGLLRLVDTYPRMLRNVRGRGLLMGFDLLDPRTGQPPDASMQAHQAFADDCQSEGLIVYPAGIAPHNHSAIVSPPLTISATDMQVLLARLQAGLDRFATRFPSH
jgi:adenosylmethionine-8-amino-7-oxononanoate aminotransferase